MSFNVKSTTTVQKINSDSNTEMTFATSDTLSCTEESINTYVIPSQGATDYIEVNLNPFTADVNQTTKYIQIETDKTIYLKMNVDAAGTSPTSDEVLAFGGILITNFALITGNLTNLYISRLLAEAGNATVKIRLFG